MSDAIISSYFEIYLYVTFDKLLIEESFFTLAVFVFGALATTVLTDILKIMSGRLRPYFLTLCNPDQTSCNGMGEYKTAGCKMKCGSLRL